MNVPPPPPLPHPTTAVSRKVFWEMEFTSAFNNVDLVHEINEYGHIYEKFLSKCFISLFD